MSEYLSVGR